MKLYNRLLRYVLPYRWVFFGGIFGMVLVALSEASFAALLKPIMDGGFVERDSAMINLTPLLLIAAFIVRGLGSFADQYSINWVGRQVVHDLRIEMFNRMIRLPADYYDQHSSGQLVAKLVYDVEQVAQATTMAVRVLIKDSLLTMALLGWLAYLNWRLTIIFLIVTPLAAFIVRVASKKFRVASQRIQSSIGEIARVSKEAFEGHWVVKAFGNYRSEEISFEKHNLWNRRESIRKATIAAASVPLLLVFVGVTVSGIIYLAMTGPGSDLITAGTFASYLGALLMLMAPIKRLATVNELIQAGIAASASIFETLEEPVEERGGLVEGTPLQGSIIFDDVSFRYSEDKPLVLDNLSFVLNPGETVAFVGESGSGKSTIASIMLGFYSEFSGKVFFDQIPIEEYQLSWLRKNIAFVPQDTLLFDDTVEANIKYGSDMNSEQFALVSTATQIDTITDDLPLGIKTKIGERGGRLSGGQRQRIAISRGLYRDAPILILDEATSALDNIADDEIRAGINHLSKGHTVIVIAHRLSTVIDVDQIYVVKNGGIVESGTHSELLECNGYYSALYWTQHGARESN